LDAAVVRAAAQRPNRALPPWPILGDDAELEQWCAWLTKVWAGEGVADAVQIASPSLAARVEEVCCGHRPNPAQVHRMVLSLARYLVRIRGRATPFGMFAGVAALRFGLDVVAGWNEDLATRVRADARWLAAVIAELESNTQVRSRLWAVTNDQAVVRGQRLVVSWQPNGADPDRSAGAEISVRYSPAVQVVMDTARCAIRIGELLDKLAAAFPHAHAGALDGMVAELVRCGVLITNLRPSSTCPDGLSYVLAQVEAIDATELDGVASLLHQVRAVRTLLGAASGARATESAPVRRDAAERMRVVSNVVEQPLAVDLALGCRVVLPPHVATEAEHTAQALLRLTPHPGGNASWRDWHQRFLTTFGAGAFVPVEQVVDSTTGLGFPCHYGESESAIRSTPLSRRDELLLALAQQAALDGAQEVILDDGILDRIAGDEFEGVQPATHVELCAQVRSPSLAALASGQFTLAVVSISRTAVALTGRFLDLLPDSDQQRMRDQYGRLPVGVAGAVTAQLSFPPKYPRTENVARAPRLLRDVLSVAEYTDNSPSRIGVDDLLVTADSNRLYLVSRSQRQVVEPMIVNATARHTWPALARFLFEVNRARTAAVSPFAWGAAGCLPFLPRVKYRRSVLVPSRWRIQPGTFPGPDASQLGWIAALEALRQRWRLPATVSVGTADRQLLLNLDEPMDLALLRSHLDTALQAGEPATITEAPTAAEHGWFAGRAHEIVVPLVTTTPPAPAPAILATAAPLPVIGRGHGVLPGAKVLFAKLYADPEAMDTILTGHLPTLLERWDQPPVWWFVRYRDPASHLRLRLRLADDQNYGQAVVRLGAWAGELRWRGLLGDLVLDTYHPETTRYGCGAALLAAEAVFAADSAAVLTQLAAQAAAREVGPAALTAASLVDLVISMAGGIRQGARWLIEYALAAAPAAHAPIDRDLVRQAIQLADLAGDRAVLLGLHGGPEIHGVWRQRQQAASAYVTCLVTGPAEEVGHLRRTSVLASLLHLHHIRATGIDPTDEWLCLRLARAVALAWNARHGTSTGGAQ